MKEFGGRDDFGRRPEVRHTFEDRELKTADGFFIDDFRGQDRRRLFHRRFPRPRSLPALWRQTDHGRWDTPVAVHVYEIG
jgi:hypothetical protein